MAVQRRAQRERPAPVVQDGTRRCAARLVGVVACALPSFFARGNVAHPCIIAGHGYTRSRAPGGAQLGILPKFSADFAQTRERLQPGVVRIAREVAREARLLDLGCGGGQLATHLLAETASPPVPGPRPQPAPLASRAQRFSPGGGTRPLRLRRSLGSRPAQLGCALRLGVSLRSYPSPSRF